MVKATLISLIAFTFVLSGLRVLADSSASRPGYAIDSSIGRQPLLTPFPRYPAIARRDRIEGEATVCFTLDRRGKVKRPAIKSYSHKIFRRPALRAIRKSTFEPLQPGQAVAKTKSCRTYRFRLDPVLVTKTAE